MEPEKNRACAGFFVPHDSKEREEIINFFKEKYQVKELPEVKTVNGEFTYKSPSISHIMGAMKFYPAASRYMASEKPKYDHLIS